MFSKPLTVWIKFDLFYNCLYFLNQKIKSSGFVAAMWAHSYLAMTHLNAEGEIRIKAKLFSNWALQV
jgi:hypothetical protein